MDFRFTFKNMQSSPALTAYAQDKLGEKINKYIYNPIESHVTFSVDGKDRAVHCHIFAREQFNIQVEAKGEYMLNCIDRLADKLEVRLRRQKEKLKSHKARSQSLIKLVVNPNSFAAGPVASFSASQPGAETEFEFDNGSDTIDASQILPYEQARILRSRSTATHSPL